MRTIVAGSRDGVFYTDVHEAMKACGWRPSVVISGHARGADRLGEQWAKENRIPVECYLADWTRFGREAGYIRNAKMAENAEALVAIWDGQSRGTKNMIDTAISKGLVVFVHKIQQLMDR